MHWLSILIILEHRYW